MVNVNLRGDVRQFENGIMPIEIAKEISPQLAKSCVCCKIDGQVKDLKAKIESDSSPSLLRG